MSKHPLHKTKFAILNSSGDSSPAPFPGGKAGNFLRELTDSESGEEPSPAQTERVSAQCGIAPGCLTGSRCGLPRLFEIINGTHLVLNAAFNERGRTDNRNVGCLVFRALSFESVVKTVPLS